MIDRLIKKLKEYKDAYEKEPYHREIEGTVELLKESVDKLTEYKWIPCSERLPEPGHRYLVSAVWEEEDFKECSVYDAVYGSDGNWHSHNYDRMTCKVTAWMPLPEPYKPESEDSEE